MSLCEEMLYQCQISGSSLYHMLNKTPEKTLQQLNYHYKIQLCHTLGNLHVFYAYQFLLNNFTFICLYLYNTEVNNQFNNVYLPEADRITQMWSV